MTASSPKITETIVSFLVDTPAAKVPEAALKHGKRVLLDTIGVTLAVSERPMGKIISQYVADSGNAPGTASVIGRGGIRTSAPLAAMANGTMSNAMDYDEGFHVATHVVPAALALAEHRGSSGRDLLDALVVGYEAGAKLTRAIDAKRKQQRGPTPRGWWHVGLVGPIAAAFTGARLLKLDKHTTAMAIGIAACSSGGFRRNMGSMAKGLHSGNAARDGIQACFLAQRGFTADPEIIEAPLGFLHAVVDEPDRELSAITERLGKPFDLETAPGIKTIPACTPAHAMIERTVAALAKGGRPADDIDSVEADLHPFSLNRGYPEDEDQAGFSGAFLVASALIHGVVGLEQVTEEAVHDPRVKALAKRIKHTPPREKGVERVTLRFKDGTTVSAEGTNRPSRHLTDDAVAGKFRDCARGALSPAAIATIEEQIDRLEKQPSIDTLMAAAGGRS